MELDKLIRPNSGTAAESISRRTFLKGSAAAGMVLDLNHSRLGSDIHILSGRGWLAISRFSREIFRLETSQFHGKPSIWHERTAQSVAFGLEGARIPGSDLLADVLCELSEGAFGVQASVAYPSLGLSFRGFAHEWLSGGGLWTRLTGRLTLANAPHMRLTATQGPARLMADGTIHLLGEGTAELPLHDLVMSTSALEFSAAHNVDSLRKSRFVLRRGSHLWNIAVPHGRWSLSEDAALFDNAEIIAHEDSSGPVEFHTRFTRSASRSQVAVRLDEPVSDSNGYKPEWNVVNPVYSLEAGDKRTAKMTASLGGPVSLQLGPLQLRLRQPEDGPALIATTNKEANVFRAEGTLSGKVQDAIILHGSDPWNVVLARDPKNSDVYAGASIKMAGKTIVLEGAVQFRLVRPQDALDLDLTMTNVIFEPILPNSWTMRFRPGADKSSPSLLIADLQPQALAEPFEPSSSPAETDVCGPMTIPKGPINRIASRTRVSMKFLQNDDDAALLTLETLLQWWRYPLFLAPRALLGYKPGTSLPSPSSPLPDFVTEIVAPAGIGFSPNENQVFVSNELLRVDQGVTQPWLARLATRRSPLPLPGQSGADGSQFAVSDDTRPQIRPVRSRHLDGNDGTPIAPCDIPEPGLYGITNLEVDVFVNNMATLVGQARHVFVSNVGAWLDLKAQFPADKTTSISGFDIRVANGEEMLEEVSLEAFLVPTGHRVTVIKTSKRQWCRSSNVSFLVSRIVQRFKIVYHDPTVTYTAYRVGCPAALELPFDSITLIGKDTPYLEWVPASDFFLACENPAGSACAMPSPAPYWAYVQDSAGPAVTISVTNPGAGYTGVPKVTVDLAPTGKAIRATAVINNGQVSAITVTDTSALADYRTMPRVTIDPPAAGLGATAKITFGVPYAFPVQCLDRVGVVHTTTMQMMLACLGESYDPLHASGFVSAYNSAQIAADFGKARIAYAQELHKGDTSHPTSRMFLKSTQVPDLPGAQTRGLPPWYPTMVGAELSLDHLAAFGNGTPASPPTFSYATQYVNAPFDYTLKPAQSTATNRGELLLRPTLINHAAATATTASAIPLNFAGHLGGGVAIPESGIQAVSRAKGAVFHALQTAYDATTDAEAFLDKFGNAASSISDIFEAGSITASLLGAVSLGDLLDQASSALNQAANLPLLAAQQLHTVQDDVADALRDALQPVLAVQAQVKTTVDSFRQQAQQVKDELNAAAALAVSFVRVTLLEQTAADITALIPIFASSPGKQDGPAFELQGLVAETVAVRIRDAIQLPTQRVPACLPTLYGLRDYAAHQLLTTPVIDQANTAIDSLETWIEQQEASLTQQLNTFQATAQSAFDALTANVLFSVSTDLDNLAASLANNGIDVDGAIQAAGDIYQDIQTVTQITTQINQQMQAIQAAVNTLTNDLPKLLQKTISDYETQLDKYLGNLAAPAVAQIKTALNAIPQSSQYQSLSSTVSAKVTAFNAVLKQLQVGAVNLLASVQSIASDINDALQMLAIPKQISVTYDYDTQLSDFSLFVASNHNTTSTFSLHAAVQLNLDGSAPSFTVSASVKNFRLMLIPSAPFISLGFSQVTFETVNGSSPKVTCPFDPSEVQFVGPMNFVAGLVNSLDLGIPLTAEVTDTGIAIGVNLPIPEVASGLFDIVNLDLYAGVDLDFTGGPMQVTFGFASPGKHFSAIYSLLGGGGFVDLTVSPFDHTQGMEIAAAIELGAMLALDFGVASGDVHAFAGFYMQLSDHDLQLTGYYRAGGNVEVLGLISVSVEFTMSLSYEDRNGTAWLSGDCELVVDVSVFLFSTSVTLDMHHDFSGTSSN